MGSASPDPCPLHEPRLRRPTSSASKCSASSKSTSTSGSRHTCYSTSTTSTLPSRSLKPATSPAKRPTTRKRGRSSQGYAAFNRQELPEADLVTIDHRPLAVIDASDLPAALRGIWDITPDFKIHIEAVHRLGSFGAVATYTAYATSSDGLEAEWRVIELLTVEGDRMNRCEIFDEADLDAALARFDEFDRPASAT